MPRLVISNKSEPFKIENGTGKLWICQCGLSKNKPFCDGSHTRTFEEDPCEMYYYTQFTQKRLNMSGVNTSNLENLRGRKEEIIFSADSIQVYRISAASKYYEDVLKIRESYLKEQAINVFDQWSDLYLLMKNDAFCATIRVTQARDGKLDVEDYYPKFLSNAQIRVVTGSANMLFKIKGSDCSPSDISNFMNEVWKDQYLDGMRIDLINATLPMRRYYQSMGYEIIGERFIHPRTEKESVAMMYIANIFNECKLSSSLADFYQENNSSRMEYESLRKLLIQE